MKRMLLCMFVLLSLTINACVQIPYRYTVDEVSGRVIDANGTGVANALITRNWYKSDIGPCDWRSNEWLISDYTYSDTNGFFNLPSRSKWSTRGILLLNTHLGKSPYLFIMDYGGNVCAVVYNIEDVQKGNQGIIIRFNERFDNPDTALLNLDVKIASGKPDVPFLPAKPEDAEKLEKMHQLLKKRAEEFYKTHPKRIEGRVLDQ